MRLKMRTLLPMSLSVLILIFLPTFASAATAQWYPSAGTVAEYTVSAQVVLDNKDVQTTTTFNLYFKTPLGVYIVPSISDFKTDWVTDGWIIRAIGATITFRHEYFDNTTTELARHSSFTANGTTYRDDIVLIGYTNETFYIGNIFSQTPDIIYTKNTYATTESGSFLDYVPNYLATDATYLNYDLIGSAGDTMILMDNHTTSYGTYNNIYFAEADGRVIKYTHNFGYLPTYTAYSSIESTSFIFSRGGGIPGYSLEILIPIAGITVLYLFWSRRKAFKENT